MSIAFGISPEFELGFCCSRVESIFLSVGNHACHMISRAIFWVVVNIKWYCSVQSSCGTRVSTSHIMVALIVLHPFYLILLKHRLAELGCGLLTGLLLHHHQPQMWRACRIELMVACACRSHLKIALPAFFHIGVLPKVRSVVCSLYLDDLSWPLHSCAI